jgi:hypothetical protein
VSFVPFVVPIFLPSIFLPISFLQHSPPLRPSYLCGVPQFTVPHPFVVPLLSAPHLSASLTPSTSKVPSPIRAHSSHSWSQSFYPQSFYQSHSFNTLPLCGHPTSAVSLNSTFSTHSWSHFFCPPSFCQSQSFQSGPPPSNTNLRAANREPRTENRNATYHIA